MYAFWLFLFFSLFIFITNLQSFFSFLHFFSCFSLSYNWICVNSLIELWKIGANKAEAEPTICAPHHLIFSIMNGFNKCLKKQFSSVILFVQLFLSSFFSVHTFFRFQNETKAKHQKYFYCKFITCLTEFLYTSLFSNHFILFFCWAQNFYVMLDTQTCNHSLLFFNKKFCFFPRFFFLLSFSHTKVLTSIFSTFSDKNLHSLTTYLQKKNLRIVIFFSVKYVRTAWCGTENDLSLLQNNFHFTIFQNHKHTRRQVNMRTYWIVLRCAAELCSATKKSFFRQ